MKKLLCVCAAVLVALGVSVSPTSAAGRSGIVVIHSAAENGKTKVDCVALTQDEINAFKQLKFSRFSFVASPKPHAICAIDKEGRKNPDDCFGALSDPYWGLWFQNKGDDVPSEAMVGADDQAVTRGTIIYWQYGTYPQSAPDPVALRDICH